MILDFFQHRDIKRFVFILFCIIVLFWQKITVFSAGNSPQPIIPVDAVFNSFAETNLYLAVFAKILLLLICSYCFIAIFTLHDILPGRKYLAVILFLCITSVFIDAQNMASSVCALLFLLFSFFNIFRTYRSDNIKSSVFIAAFFTGISILFSFSFMIAIINLIPAIWFFSVITWRNLISMFLGLLTPFIFLLYFFQIAYHDINFMWIAIENNFRGLVFTLFEFNDFSAFFMGFVFLVAFLSMFKTYRYTKTIQKMTNKLFYFLFIISAIVTVFMLHMKPYGVMLFGISTAYLLVRFSQIIKHKWIAEFIVFVILIASVVYNNYYMVSF